MEDTTNRLPHTLLIDNRNRMTVTGVTDVGSFNESLLQIATSMGELGVTGENLQVTKLDLERGEITVEGKIVSLSYAENIPKTGGLFARMFS